MEGATVTVDRSAIFPRTSVIQSKMLGEIDSVTNLLQKKKATLSDCKMYVYSLLHEVSQYRIDENSVLYVCQLGDKYLSVDARNATDPYFEAGVVKL